MKRYIVAAVLLASAVCLAQTYSLSPVPAMQFLNMNGQPLNGGFVYTYQAGTLNPLTAYSDANGTAFPNPIQLNAGGFPQNASNAVSGIFLPVRTAYKFCITDQFGAQQYCIDNIENTQIGSAADVIALWGGTCNGSTWLRGDGFCATPAGGGNISSSGLTSNVMPMANGTTTLTNGPLQYFAGGGSPFLSLINTMVAQFDLSNASNAGILKEVPDGGGAAVPGSLYKLNSSGQAVLAGTSDTTIQLYISYNENSGYNQLYVLGTAVCTFDNSQTAGDIVVASTSAAGECHDTGSTTRPLDTFYLGTVANSTSHTVLYSPGFTPSAASGVGGTGTVNTIPLWTAASTQGSSDIMKWTNVSPYVYRVENSSGQAVFSTGFQGVTESYPDGGTTATLLATLKLNGTTTSVATTTISQTDVVAWPVASYSGGGNVYAEIAVAGSPECHFDAGGSTAGDYVGASTATAGRCMDLGVSAFTNPPPTGHWIVGVACCTVAANATTNVTMIGQFF